MRHLRNLVISKFSPRLLIISILPRSGNTSKRALSSSIAADTWLTNEAVFIPEDMDIRCQCIFFYEILCLYNISQSYFVKKNTSISYRKFHFKNSRFWACFWSWKPLNSMNFHFFKFYD